MSGNYRGLIYETPSNLSNVKIREDPKILEKRYSTRTNFTIFFFFFKESGDEFKNNRTKTRLLSYPRVITFDYYSSFKSTVTRVLGVATYPREVTIHPGVNTRVTRPCASFAPRYDSCELQDRTDRRYKYRAVIGWDIKEISIRTCLMNFNEICRR